MAALAQDVNELAASLANTERQRSRLVSEVAHELRTPLTALQGQLEGLAEGVIAFDEAEIASMHDDIEHRITTDLSSLSRAEENAFELRVEAVDVSDLVTEVTDRLRPQFEDQRVVLTVKGVHATLDADPDRLRQLLTNLIGNALAATPPGGVVTASVASDDPWTITDTGRGLAPDQLERVFHRCERIPLPDGTLPGSGSGIGLTIARSIAQAHGATLTATSPGLDLGATFTLSIPAYHGRGEGR